MNTEISSQLAAQTPQRAGSAGRPATQAKADVDSAQLATRPVPAGFGSEQTANKQEVKDEELNAAVLDLNKLAKMSGRELKFSVDQDTQQTVVKVVDAETDEVIRQIPSEEVLAIARNLKDSPKGGLLQERA